MVINIFLPDEMQYFKGLGILLMDTFIHIKEKMKRNNKSFKGQVIFQNKTIGIKLFNCKTYQYGFAQKSFKKSSTISQNIL